MIKLITEATIVGISDKEYTTIVKNLPTINSSNIDDIIKEAFKNESGKQSISDVDYGKVGIEFQKNGNIILRVSNVSTIDKSIGEEELGNVNFIYTSKTKKWNLSY